MRVHRFVSSNCKVREIMPTNFAFSLHISGTAHIAATTILSIGGREDWCKSCTIWICFWHCKSFAFPLQVNWLALPFNLIYPQSFAQPSSPLFGKYGGQLGPKMCFNIGSVLQGVSGFLFGFLPYFKDVGAFIGLSYLLRFLEGMGTAMAWSAALGILMKIFPNKVGIYCQFNFVSHFHLGAFSTRLQELCRGPRPVLAWATCSAPPWELPFTRRAVSCCHSLPLAASARSSPSPSA